MKGRLISLVSLLCILGSGPVRAGQDDLAAFIANLQKQTGTSRDGDYQRNATAQFKQLESAIKRGDFDRAQQMLQNAGGYGLPPELQEAWATLADQLAVQIEQQQQQAAIKWKAQVDALLKQVAAACEAAKTSDDLDEALVACSALQMRRVSQNNILAQRANQKLESIAQSLQTWCRFLDAAAAQNAQQANGILREILNSGGAVPVLSRDAVTRRFLPETKSPTQPSQALQFALADVKGPEDLPKAIERVQELTKNPEYQNDATFMRAPTALQLLIKANDTITAKKFDTASDALQSYSSTSSYGIESIQSLADGLRRQIVIAQLTDLAGQKPASDEAIGDFLKRIADQLKTEKKYVELLRVIDGANIVSRANLRSTVTFPWTPGDAVALRAYNTAAQFEAAGDVLPAINQYRIVITSGQGGKYAPTMDAQKALEKIKATNPDALKDLNNAVLNELRTIQEQVSRIQATSRSPGNPYYSR